MDITIIVGVSPHQWTRMNITIIVREAGRSREAGKDKTGIQPAFYISIYLLHYLFFTLCPSGTNFSKTDQPPQSLATQFLPDCRLLSVISS